MISQLKKIFLVFCLSGAAYAQAQTDWLNIVGDGDNPAVNTVEVDPTPLGGSDALVFRVRVSRSASQVSWDGIRYRSFQSQVQFDCANNTAKYLAIDFFLAPGWKGASHHTSVYTQPPRLMDFPEIAPNPAPRIVRAACESSSVVGN